MILKAILVDCIPSSLTPEEASFRLAEAESLIKTYGGIVLIKKIQKRQTPDLRTFIGSGKLKEIIEESQSIDANILIINNELKPHQTYNINEYTRSAAKCASQQASQRDKPEATRAHGAREEASGYATAEAYKPSRGGQTRKRNESANKIFKEPMQAWDRIDLILKIFQKHAGTREARLEIELASIKHMGPRIFGMGMQLSRQGGGIGTRGGGETNLEIMKRHLSKMEHSIKQELEACKKVRQLHRAGRKRLNLPTVGIIGYTNAGKSTLLNALTHKGAYAADKLFATLDTRVGKMYIHPHEILISDTIGFIQDLPTTLIKSFQSTLEESIQADVLLHVIDVSDPRFLKKIEVVNEILFKIDALMKPTIYVFNKIDRAPALNRQQLEQQFKIFHPTFVSSTTKEGLETLKHAIRDALFPTTQAPSATGVLDVIKDLKQQREQRTKDQRNEK